MYKFQQACCVDTTKMQEEYYLNQAGGALPHFVGGEFQRGHGLGTRISGYMRSAIPLLLNKGVTVLKKNALKTALGVASDVVRGKDLKTSMLTRGLAALKADLTSELTPTATPKKKPIKRRAPKKSVSSVPTKRRRGYNSTLL